MLSVCGLCTPSGGLLFAIQVIECSIGGGAGGDVVNVEVLFSELLTYVAMSVSRCNEQECVASRRVDL